MKNLNWIQELIESSYVLFANHDPKSHLPFDAWGLHPYYSSLWLEKIYEMICKFEEKGLKIKDCLSYFPNLSSTRFIMLINTIQYQTSKMNNPKLIAKIQDFFVESLMFRAKEDLFSKEKNIDLDDKQLNNLLNERKINIAGKEESKEIGKILAGLASLTHGLYNDWSTDFNYEISGPYIKNNKTILIRSFADLKPIEIWPEINWKFKNISIITEYTDLSAKIAFVGCHILYSANTVEKLTGYNLKIDDKEVNGLEQLKKIREELMSVASLQYEKFMNMDFEGQKIKYVFQEHYQLKKLFELVGMDWKPSSEIISRIKDKQLIENVFPSYEMTIEDYKEDFGFNKLVKAYQE